MAVFVNRLANDVGTTASLLHSDSSNKCILIGLNFSNKTASSVPINLFLRKNSVDYHIIVGKRVPANESVEVMQGNKIVMDANDELYVKSGVVNSVDVVASLLHGVE
jgi:hypothetical protein